MKRIMIILLKGLLLLFVAGWFLWSSYLVWFMTIDLSVSMKVTFCGGLVFMYRDLYLKIAPLIPSLPKAETGTPIIMSEFGRTFDGKALNEDTLNSGVKVSYGDRVYVTGNQRYRGVELFGIGDDNELKRIVPYSKIKLVRDGNSE